MKSNIKKIEPVDLVFEIEAILLPHGGSYVIEITRQQSESCWVDPKFLSLEFYAQKAVILVYVGVRDLKSRTSGGVISPVFSVQKRKLTFSKIY